MANTISHKVVSVLMAVVLALGMCVPAVALSAFHSDKAWAGSEELTVGNFCTNMAFEPSAISLSALNQEEQRDICSKDGISPKFLANRTISKDGKLYPYSHAQVLDQIGIDLSYQFVDQSYSTPSISAVRYFNSTWQAKEDGAWIDIADKHLVFYYDSNHAVFDSNDGSPIVNAKDWPWSESEWVSGASARTSPVVIYQLYDENGNVIPGAVQRVYFFSNAVVKDHMSVSVDEGYEASVQTKILEGLEPTRNEPFTSYTTPDTFAAIGGTAADSKNFAIDFNGQRAVFVGIQVKPVSYTITYKDDSASNSFDVQVYADQPAGGRTPAFVPMARAAEPVRDGYEFVDWYHVETASLGRDLEVTSDATYQAVWKAAGDPTTLRLTSPADITAGVSYTAIKVFDADILGKYGDEEAPKATNIAFAPGVTSALINPDDDGMNAQVAAEYISANIEHEPGVGLAYNEYGMELAKRLHQAGIAGIEVTADSDEFKDLAGSGYYLIVRTDVLTGENTVASSPIYAALTGENTIALKVAVPTLTKQIQEDKTGEWGKEADHTLNQDVNYKLIGTIAENVEAYATYAYNFHDTWDGTRMSINEGSVKVFVNDQEITTAAGVTITPAAGSLDVTIADLRAIHPTLAATDVVTVTYTAHQIKDYKDAAAAATDGIQNEAYLEYSNNPIMSSIGTTKKDTTKDYSYSLKIHKTDNATGESLAGVEFSIKNTVDGGYLAVVDGKLVQDSATPYPFVTDENGMIYIYGVDADSYEFVETKALDTYEKLNAPFTVTVSVLDRSNVNTTVSDHELVGMETESATEPIAAPAGVTIDASLTTDNVASYAAVPLVVTSGDNSFMAADSWISTTLGATGTEYDYNALVSKITTSDEELQNIAATVYDYSNGYVTTSGVMQPEQFLTPGTTTAVSDIRTTASVGLPADTYPGAFHYTILVPVDTDHNRIAGESAILVQMSDTKATYVDASSGAYFVEVGTMIGGDNTPSPVINVKNVKQIELPSTGEAGCMLLVVAAIGAAVAVVIRRKQRNIQEQHDVRILSV